MRILLTVMFSLSLASAAHGAWSDFLTQEFPKTPWAQRPRVERTVCLDCHAAPLMKEEYQGLVADWRKSWHYQNGVSCQDCHGGDPRDATRSMMPESGFVGVPKPREVPEFCGKCHLGIKENYLESGHGKALKATGRGPNCVLCHASHNVQKANINLINEKLCGVCHSYDRAKTIKASLLLTEEQLTETEKRLQTLRAGLIASQDEAKTLFQIQAEYRTLFHSVDVNLVKERTDEFNKKLAALNAQVDLGFRELRFRQDFSVFIMLVFVGLGVVIFFLGRGAA